MPPKTKSYASAGELVEKLEGRAAMWHRVARENEDRAAKFDSAVREIMAGATSVTVGRTTYKVDEGADSA